MGIQFGSTHIHCWTTSLTTSLQDQHPVTVSLSCWPNTPWHYVQQEPQPHSHIYPRYQFWCAAWTKASQRNREIFKHECMFRLAMQRKVCQSAWKHNVAQGLRAPEQALPSNAPPGTCCSTSWKWGHYIPMRQHLRAWLRACVSALRFPWLTCSSFHCWRKAQQTQPAYLSQGSLIHIFLLGHFYGSLVVDLELRPVAQASRHSPVQQIEKLIVVILHSTKQSTHTWAAFCFEYSLMGYSSRVHSNLWVTASSLALINCMVSTYLQWTAWRAGWVQLYMCNCFDIHFGTESLCPHMLAVARQSRCC